MFTREPDVSAARLVAESVCGIRLTENVSPVTSFTVRLTPSSAIEPLLQFSFNTDFRLDEAEARRLSPVHLQPATDATFLVAAGANETSEFVRQAQLLWQAWPRNRPRNAHGPMLIPERHHFDVVLDYTDPQSELTGATLALFER